MLQVTLAKGMYINNIHSIAVFRQTRHGQSNNSINDLAEPVSGACVLLVLLILSRSLQTQLTPKILVILTPSHVTGDPSQGHVH